ncbi:hypothetical protein MSG28_013391, partial [Choristoneura fumiferana]
PVLPAVDSQAEPPEKKPPQPPPTQTTAQDAIEDDYTVERRPSLYSALLAVHPEIQ